jgi:hypothetical protein
MDASALTSKFKEAWQQSLDQLQEQQWYQQAKQQWDELDPQSKLYIKSSAILGVVVGVLIAVFSTILSVRQQRQDLAARLGLISYVESQSELLRRLRESNQNASGAGAAGPWNAYLEGVAAAAGIDKASLTLSPEKPGTQGDSTQETLIELSVKKVSIRNVVRLAQGLEAGARPVKVRHISIDTHADPEGYLDAQLALSAFVVKEAQP